MEAYQERVVSERADLHEKIDRLAQFLDSKTFHSLPVLEQMRLERQLGHMNNYRDTLDERIAAFT